MEEPVTIIDRDVLKVLSVDTRMDILKELSAGDRTPSDLGKKLSKSDATIVEHLDVLCKHGLVKRIEQPGKKWVFYTLTERGYGIVSSKSRRNLNKELSQFDAFGVEFRYDKISDLDTMFSMNKNSYGEYSYFNDDRFMRSFENLTSWLKDNGMLRITTALIGGRVAAVDMGTVWNKNYTLLAGGTHPEFPGVAKLINFHHMKWGCEQKMECIDFLSGDFGWKQRFHLTPRPLYEIHSNMAEKYYQPEFAFSQNDVAYAL